MKITQKFIVTLVICGLMGMPFSYAKDNDSSKGMKGMGARNDVILNQLNLSPEQKKILDANKEAQMGDIKGLLDQRRKVGDELNEVLMDPQMDMNKVNDLNNEIKSIQGKMADKRIGFIMDVRKTLTPEQFSKFIKLTGELRQEKMNRRSEKLK